MNIDPNLDDSNLDDSSLHDASAHDLELDGGATAEAEGLGEDPWAAEPENSLMVVTTREEYCFLWDRDCFPELAESLLGCGERTLDEADLLGLPTPEPTRDALLTVDQFRAVVRDLVTGIHQDL